MNFNNEFVTGSRPGSTDGDGYHHTGHVSHMNGHVDSSQNGHVGMSQHLPNVGPKIRALQHQLKLTDISEAKGSLV